MGQAALRRQIGGSRFACHHIQPLRERLLERRNVCDSTNSNADAEPASTPSVRLFHVLMLPDLERADRIGEFWGYPESRAFAELLIDCEEDRTLRAVLVGMLREMEH